MPEEIIQEEINAAAKIIADISTGMYRSPASAIKELVSNSFDAGATEVVVTTGYRDFRVLTCYDNGDGISAKDFRDVMHYIGGSLKREDNGIGKFERPIIGKIGIGILAIAQIKDRFTIVSSCQGEETKFEAEIDLGPFQKKEALRATLGRGTIGTYRMAILPEEKEKHYTIVTTEDMKVGFRVRLAGQIGLGYKRKEPKVETFTDFVKSVAGKRLSDLDEYSQMLWELSLLCPVPYFEDGPIRGWDGWEAVKSKLENYNFRLIVDGYELQKPILLPNEPDIMTVPNDYKVYDFSFDQLVNGRPLRFHGYIYHQRKQIRPPELQGIVVRIRNVAIRGFDKSFLNYPMSIGPMLRGMCGEIYVEEGLEDALNIDRNSFRETDEHYLALQRKVFETLGAPEKTGITQDIRERSVARMEQQRESQVIESYKTLESSIKRAVGKRFTMVLSSEQMPYPIRVDTEASQIFVSQNHPSLPRNHKERVNMVRFLTAYELACSMETDIGRQRERFYDILRRI